VLLALPGNPLAALVTFLWFARPVIEKRMGLTPTLPVSVKGRAAFSETRTPGRDEFVPVSMRSGPDGQLWATKLGRGGSARLAPLVSAHGLARISGALEVIEEGASIDLYLFENGFSL
jgi:molybdopterin molybdotransferase